MIASLLLCAALVQGPAPPPPQEEGPWRLQVARSEVEVAEEEVVYRLSALILDGPGRAARADTALLRLDRARYEAALAGHPLPPRVEAPGTPGGRLAGRWLVRLLGGMGLPEDPDMLRELVLDGHVLLEGEGLRLRCSRLSHLGPTGETEVQDADLLLTGAGPNGWPVRVRTALLKEDAQGGLHTEEAELTTCDLPDPHYAVRLARLDILPLPDGETLWSPEGAWLEVGGTAILPLPASDFRSGESSFGLQGLRFFSNSALGTGLEPEFGWRSAPSEEAGGLAWNLRLKPGVSSLRGLPVQVQAGLAAGPWEGEWRLFWLADQGSDRHRLAERVARGGDQRWRVRLDNRFDLGERWLLDADLAVTSDPLVDPEFFGPEWRREDDARSELYLRRSGDTGFAEAWAIYRLDGVGFTPFDGLPPPGSPAPETIETLPRVRYERFPETLLALPLDWAGARGRILPVDLAWGTELAVLRRRSRDLEAPPGLPPFSVVPALTRQRARAWAELATSWSVGGVFVRPGYRFTALAYDDDLGGTGRAERGLGELFVEAGLALAKDWEHGWRHQVLPQVRFRDRRSRGLDPARLVQYDEWDALAEGQVVELSLRQFYFAPEGGEPWLDLNLLLPYYPDPSRPLVDPLFPYARPGHGGGRWGPAELRMTWTPGVYGETLEGVRLETRWRQDLDEGRLDELFTRLDIQPRDDLRYGLVWYKVDNRFSLAEFQLDWRFADRWALAVLAPWTFTGAPSRNSSLAIRRYFHDLVVEVGVSRSSADGRSGFFFNFAPRFLVDRR